jgi:hypothetical protein
VGAAYGITNAWAIIARPARGNRLVPISSTAPRSGVPADRSPLKVPNDPWLLLKLTEKRGELVRQSDVNALIDDLVGVTLSAMSSMPARCAPRGDLAIRRCIERVVFEVRTEIANIAQRKADEVGEPPLSEQADGMTNLAEIDQHRARRVGRHAGNGHGGLHPARRFRPFARDKTHVRTFDLSVRKR